MKNLPVLERFVPSLRKRMARLLWPNGQGIVRHNGVSYLVNLNSRNWYGKQILQWGPPDLEQRTFLLQNVLQRKCDTFIDAGANFGLYTTFMASHANCSTIRAYEPDSRAYDNLRANLLINGLSDKVETRMVAVSDHNGTVPYILGPANDDSSSEVGVEGSNGYSVPSVRLDDDLPLKGHRIAFKFDVQYHELIALQGMKSLLRDNDCFLQVELVEKFAAPFIAAMQAEGYNLVHRIEIDYYFARKAVS